MGRDPKTLEWVFIWTEVPSESWVTTKCSFESPKSPHRVGKGGGGPLPLAYSWTAAKGPRDNFYFAERPWEERQHRGLSDNPPPRGGGELGGQLLFRAIDSRESGKEMKICPPPPPAPNSGLEDNRRTGSRRIQSLKLQGQKGIKGRQGEGKGSGPKRGQPS